jgi:hypothetical protein
MQEESTQATLVFEASPWMRVGAWTIVGKSCWRRGRHYWLCRCECGTERYVDVARLKAKTAKHCGCKHPQTKAFGESSAYNRFGIYRRSALKLGRAFDLTFEQFKAITAQACHYCGIRPLQIHRAYDRNGEFTYNGMDRIDNSQGYVESNVVACCGTCNYAKSIRGYDEFIEWLDRIAAYRSQPW